MTQYIDAQIGILRAQAAFMQAGIARMRSRFLVPVSNNFELKALHNRLAEENQFSFSNSEVDLSMDTNIITEKLFVFSGFDGIPFNSRCIVEVDYRAKRLPILNSVSHTRTSRPYLINVPVDLIQVPNKLIKILSNFYLMTKDQLKRANRSEEIFWSVGLRKLKNDEKFRVDAQIDIDYETGTSVPIEVEEEFTHFVGSGSVLALGMTAQTISDRWANRPHPKVRPALAVSAGDGHCTVTAIVKQRGSGKGGKRFALTVGHGTLPTYHKLNRDGLTESVHVHQPAGNRNIDRIIGSVAGGSYNPVHNLELDFDAGLIELDGDKIGPNSFGKDGQIITGISSPPIEGEEVAFYGSVSGFKSALVRRTDVSAEIMARDEVGSIIRIYMSGLIELIATQGLKRDRPVAAAGDSGAPVIVQSFGNFSLVGYLVASGVKRATRRHPRTYAAPSDRLFDALDIELA